MTVISFVAEYDEIIRKLQDYLEKDLTDEFLAFAEHQEYCRIEWLKSVKECTRLQADLDKVKQEIGDYMHKLNHARKLLDQEKKHRRRVEEERSKLEQQMLSARELLFSCRLSEDTKEKLGFLGSPTNRFPIKSSDQNIHCTKSKLNTAMIEVNLCDINSTETLLSNFSYSRSEDDLDVSSIKSKKWKAYRLDTTESTDSTETSSSLSKDIGERECDKIVTEISSVPKCSIENVPQNPESDLDEREPNIEMKLKSFSTFDKNKWSAMRTQHSFIPKTIIKSDICASCNKRIRFGKMVLKCKSCRSICHTECKEELSLPCKPLSDTPKPKDIIGTIADFTSTQSPMVPGFLVHCLNEIERRGSNEIGLYEVSACDNEVKRLKEQILRNKSLPVLNEIDINVICGVVKDFLRSLQEPLITNALRNDFIRAVTAKDSIDIVPCMYQAISQLAQPNRDTLAFLMLHLMKVAENPDCRMSIDSLAKVFGPIIVGYSSRDPRVRTGETQVQAMIMEHLIRIPIWDTYINGDSKTTTPRSKILLKTPSTTSLAKSTSSRHLFSPNFTKSVQSLRKKRKFFPTSPKH